MTKDKDKICRAWKRYRANNLEVIRERDRSRKRKLRELKRGQVNAAQREWYARNPAREARKQNERRIKREPHRGIRKAILASEAGAINLAQLIEFVGGRVALSNEVYGAAGRFRKNNGRIHGSRRKTNRKKHLRRSVDEGSCSKADVCDIKR